MCSTDLKLSCSFFFINPLHYSTSLCSKFSDFHLGFYLPLFLFCGFYRQGTPCIIDCVMAELEKLGQKYRVALRCSFMNFSRNTRCLKCKEKGPKRVATDDVQMKKGDWNCPGRNQLH
ncbi:uncharacterized protein LOC108471294 [Gossypium arboreum]|uniref:uncharacterized protein LOC108471294 n=1 Tax=Gossypium arboreum TaxID=29729 RepID=UPI0008191C96|nr:uncharacterized protein LOC108471294 [Gossypium arboreum]